MRGLLRLLMVGWWWSQQFNTKGYYYARRKGLLNVLPDNTKIHMLCVIQQEVPQTFLPCTVPVFSLLNKNKKDIIFHIIFKKNVISLLFWLVKLMKSRDDIKFLICLGF